MNRLLRYYAYLANKLMFSQWLAKTIFYIIVLVIFIGVLSSVIYTIEVLGV